MKIFRDGLVNLKLCYVNLRKKVLNNFSFYGVIIEINRFLFRIFLFLNIMGIFEFILNSIVGIILLD